MTFPDKLPLNVSEASMSVPRIIFALLIEPTFPSKLPLRLPLRFPKTSPVISPIKTPDVFPEYLLDIIKSQPDKDIESPEIFLILDDEN